MPIKPPLVEWITLRGFGPEINHWLVWARNKAQFLYRSGIRNSQCLRMADGTDVRIHIDGSHAHIAVIGVGTEFRYQFITTLQENSTYSSGGFMVLNGSAVSVRLVPADGILRLQAKATGSTLETLPDGTEPLTSVRDTPLIKIPIQVQLIPEPVYTGYSENGIEQEKKYAQLLHSWASIPGAIYNAGFYMPAPTFNDTDKGYDAAPSLITSALSESRMPDADWPHSACIVTVDSVEFGARRFIVLADASSRFYCWPTIYENAADEYLYPVDSPYIDQAIKTNVAAAITQSLTPPFPAWVHVPVGQRRDTDWPSTVNSGEPRYGWKFHPLGTHVVGTVLSRTAFAATVKGRTTSTLTYLPFTEVDIDDLKINPSRFSDIRGSAQTYNGSMQYDLPGWVEFSLNIVITGPNPEDFTFGMTLTREQSADATHYPISADYLHPVLDGWNTYGIDGTPGDLIVLDLASYIDDRGLTWIARNCGYLGDTEYKVRQTWATIHNIDASGAELLRFLVKNQPSDFDLRRYDLDAPEGVVHTGRFVHIDLARLSFVYFAQLAKYTVDTSDYAHGYTGRNPTTGTMLFGCRQRWESSETGLRYIVFGKIVHEVRGGNDFELWNTIDGLSLADGMTRFSPIETGTRWLTYATATQHRRHWLASDLPDIEVTKNDAESMAPITRVSYYDTEVSNYITIYSFPKRITLDISQLSNSALKAMSILSSGTTGDEYTASESITETETSNGLPHPNTVITWTLDAVVNNLQQTDIKSKLSVGCSSIDSSYFDTLVDWLKELMERHFMKGSYDPYLVSEIMGTKQWGYYTTQNSGYFPISPSMDTRHLAAQDEPIFYSYYDYIFDTYNATNKHHRVHHYPIGAEWMLREWFAAIEVDANFSLSVCPEGFYAGHVWLPSISGHIAQNTLLVDKDYTHEPYFMPADDPYVSYYGIQATHVIKSDVIPCLDQFGSYYVYYNVPDSSQLAMTDVDLIGHISGVKTSHASAYQKAYQHILNIVDPSVRIIADTGQGYVYEKGVHYNGDTLWSDLLGKVSIFNAPRKNGAMLFSK